MAGQTTFLLGVGAQKAATTWLYEYLNAHPDCALGRIKEQTVLNLVYQPQHFPEAEETKFNRLRFYKNKRHKGEPFDPVFLGELLDNFAMGYDLERYWAYFRKQAALLEGRSGVIGDITPAYCALSADNFSQVRARILAEGYRPRVVFLMRDPVDRCSSMARMGRRLKGDKSGIAHRHFAYSATQPWAEIRTRYENTVRALDSAFAADEVFYGFFEDFLTETEVARCCAFLGIDDSPADFGTRQNASRLVDLPSAEDIAHVRAFYDETYRFCMDRFGADRIKALWKHA